MLVNEFMNSERPAAPLDDRLSRLSRVRLIYRSPLPLRFPFRRPVLFIKSFLFVSTRLNATYDLPRKRQNSVFHCYICNQLIRIIFRAYISKIKFLS